MPDESPRLDSLPVGIYDLADEDRIRPLNTVAARLLGIEAGAEGNTRDLFETAADHAAFRTAVLGESAHVRVRMRRRGAAGETFQTDHFFARRDARGVLGAVVEIPSDSFVSPIRSLADHTPRVAIQLATSDGTVRFWNPASTDLYGYDEKEMLGRSIKILLADDEEVLRAEKAIAGVVTSGDASEPRRWKTRRKDGSIRWVFSTIFRLDVGEPEPLIGYMDVDVTEEHLRQESLTKLSRMYADAERVGRLGSWEWDVTTRHAWWSPELRRMYGFDVSEPGESDYRAFFAIVHPDDRERVRRALDMAVASGAGIEAEYRIVRKDGVELWVAGRGEISRGEDGAVTKIFGTVHDITDERRQQELLREKDAHINLLIEQLPAIVWTTDRELRLTSMRGRAMRALGLVRDDVTGLGMLEFYRRRGFAAAKAEMMVEHHRQALAGASINFMHESPTGVWLYTHLEPLRDAAGNVAGCIGVAQDVTEQRRAEEQLAHQANHDALTGLPNRILLHDRLTVALANAARRSSHVAAIFVDLDRFKLINDTLGHSAGDQLLAKAAERLTGTVRGEDTVARVGGDEFVIVLPSVASADDGARVAEHVLQVMSVPFRIDSQELFVTASAGIALYPQDGRTAENLIRSADSAMYRAKELGRNNYQLCTPELTEHALQRLALENGLRRAIELRQFVLFYQPMIDAASGRVSGLEALVRWNHPDRGILAPGEFMRIAEESRLIVGIGKIVLEEACRQLREWQKQDLPVGRLAVNVSAREFQRGDFAFHLSEIASAAGIHPSSLDVEITETAAMQNPELSVGVIRDLSRLGANVIIDDFGVGYSSLNYLRQFPIQGLKIDRTFVADLPGSRSNAAIVRAVIATAKALGLRLTAEGVETVEQLEFLRSEGCSDVQGYHFSKPRPAGEVPEMLRSLEP